MKRGGRFLGAAALSAYVVLLLPRAYAATEPPRGAIDSRVRTVGYDVDQVYQLHGYVGYQIDIEFAPDERFVGLGAGDVDALSFVGERNHLFLKPKAAHVATNITVVTTKRTYQIDYTASMPHPSAYDDVVYALRFEYLRVKSADTAAHRRLDRELHDGATGRPRNFDYWYCGDPALKPVAAWDDGVHMRLRFAAGAEMPAIFLRNDDGSESLLNFSIAGGDVIVQRVARRFILRRGRLTGCIVNAGYSGGASGVRSGTAATDVVRVTRGETHEHRE